MAYLLWTKRSTFSSTCSSSCKRPKEVGIPIDKPKREKPKTEHIPENITAVVESVREGTPTSTRRRYQQINISETSLRRILV